MGYEARLGEPLEPFRILDPEGRPEAGLPDGLPPEGIVGMYRWLVQGRVFDQRMLQLQRQGRIGTYAPVAGQEAAQVGLATAMSPDDWLFPSYREVLAALMLGVPMADFVRYFRGLPRRGSPSPAPEAPEGREGSRGGEGGAVPHVFPVQIAIADQLLHAVGAAMAFRAQGRDAVAVTCAGDGATSEGDFHEAANFAGVHRVPVVFFIQNNHWAISVPRAAQTASATIAQKALAYGFAGVMVDGNDALAVYQVAREALDRARRGDGPTLIEAVTYRLGPHTTADDPTRYRSAEELALWQARDPIPRLRRYLEGQGWWDEAQEARLQEEAAEAVIEAVHQAEVEPPPDPTVIFDITYAEPTLPLREQKAEMRRLLGGTEGGDGPWPN